MPLGMAPLPPQLFSKLTGTVQDEQHPCTSAAEHDPKSHMATEGSASCSPMVDPSCKLAEDDDKRSAQPGEATAASMVLQQGGCRPL